MAPGPAHGRLGQVDLIAIGRHAALNDPWAPYERSAARRPSTNGLTTTRWTSATRSSSKRRGSRFLLCRTTTFGRSLCSCSPTRRSSSSCIFLFSQWNLALGLLARLSLRVQRRLPEPGVVCVLLLLGHSAHVHRPGLAAPRVSPSGSGRSLARADGVALGGGVWLRGSWWPLSVFLFALAGLTPSCAESHLRRRHLRRDRGASGRSARRGRAAI